MSDVQIVEVGPRDGLQSVEAFVPTDDKIRLIRLLYEAGIRRAEVTSFVNARAVPQLADAAEIVAVAAEIPDFDAQVLVPTARYCATAIEAGAAHLAFVLSVTESHNRGNVKRSPAESVDEYAAIMAMAGPDTPFRLNVATAFDCPYEGIVPQDSVIRLLEALIPIAPHVEVALCDTTGKATPGHVADLFGMVQARFPGIAAWAFHGHDTYGMGAANALAAYNAGVRIFDAAVGGLGGCPFAPGATGNVATEDLVWMFDGMGLSSGIDLGRLLDAARMVKAIPGAQSGGRVLDAISARKPA